MTEMDSKDEKNQNAKTAKIAPTQYENVEIYIASLGQTFSYFMTNDICEINKRLNIKGFYIVKDDMRWNPKLAQEVRDKMTELGMAYSMTLTNGARVVNFYEEGLKIPCIMEILETKLLYEKMDLLSILRGRECITEDRIQLIGQALDKLIAKWTSYESAIKNNYQKEIRLIYLKNAVQNYKTENIRQGLELLHSVRTKSYEQLEKILEKDGLSIVSDKKSDLPEGLSFNDTLDFFISKFTDGGLKDSSTIYKNTTVDGSGGMSKQTFSKIRNNKKADYRPTKKNVFLLAIGMNLNIEESEILLKSAGYSFDEKSEFEKIVKGFIRAQNYDMEQIEDALYEKTEDTLGNWGEEN